MDLLEAARRARDNAYAPYSGFRVGAAVRCPDGSAFAGCNVENVAYPQGTCAEAGAIAAMNERSSPPAIDAVSCASDVHPRHRRSAN